MSFIEELFYGNLDPQSRSPPFDVPCLPRCCLP